MPYRTQQIFVPQTPAEMAAAEAQDYADQRPWDRHTTTPIYDMFGPVDTGDLKVEMARKMAAQAHDQAIAYETAKVRMASPRGFGLDSTEAIDRELFQPIRKEYGIHDPVVTQRQWFKPAHGPNGEFGTEDTRTGQVTWATAGKAKPDEKVDVPTLLDNEKKVVRHSKWTLKEFADNYDLLPAEVKALPEIMVLRRRAGMDVPSMPKMFGVNPDWASQLPSSASAPMFPESAPAFTPPEPTATGSSFMGTPGGENFFNSRARFQPQPVVTPTVTTNRITLRRIR